MSKPFKDRIMIFQKLVFTDEESSEIDEDIFSSLLKDQYEEYVSFCNEVLYDSSIINISCKKTKGNKLVFYSYRKES